MEWDGDGEGPVHLEFSLPNGWSEKPGEPGNFENTNGCQLHSSHGTVDPSAVEGMTEREASYVNALLVDDLAVVNVDVAEFIEEVNWVLADESGEYVEVVRRAATLAVDDSEYMYESRTRVFPDREYMFRASLMCPTMDEGPFWGIIDSTLDSATVVEG